MDSYTLFTITILLLLAIVSLYLWRARAVTQAASAAMSAILALIALQLLLVLEGSARLPSADSDLTGQIVAAIGFTLGVNAVIQLLKWLIMAAVSQRIGIVVPRFLLDLVGWLALAGAALFVARAVFGAELTGILVTSTVVSAVIGLALQDTLAHLISGISLQLEAPYRVDDWLEVGGHEGRLIRQGWRSLTLQTRRNNLVTVTNSQVAQGSIVNYSRPTRHEVQIVRFGVRYEHPPERVKAVVAAAIKGVEGVVDTFEPVVALKEFGDFSVNYWALFEVADFADGPRVSDRVMTRLWYALRRAGIEIPFPIQDLQLHTATEEVQATAERQARVEQAVGRIELLSDLSAAQRARLTQAADLRLYGTGEVLVEQGAAGDSLFILLDGDVDVRVADADGRDVSVDHLTSGDFFGEMSLLTGEPRNATVITERETTVLTLTRQAFADVLAVEPAIFERFLDALDRRQANMDTRLAAWRAELATESEGRAFLVRRIFDFLGLAPPKSAE